MRSLRTRLLTGIIIGMILLLTIFSLLIYITIRSALFKQFDTSLASVVQVLAASVELDDDEIELEFEVQQMPEFQNSEYPTYYQLWKTDGTVVAKSPLLGKHDLQLPKYSLKTFIFWTSRDRKGQSQRAVGLNFVPRNADNDEENANDFHQTTNEQMLTMVVARDTSDLQRQLWFLRWLLLTASVGVIALSFIIAAFVVRQGLRPLNSIASEIAAIKVENLTNRIDTKNVPTEAVPIKNRLNELLTRLETSFNRERQFNADVAHELRTPLAGIRSTIEVALSRTRDSDEYKIVLSDCLTIIENMQTIVNNLLMLTRLDSQQISFKTEQIQLSKLVNSCWLCFNSKANEQKIIFENRIPSEITCGSDSEHLSMVILNLLDNAVEYTNENGQIWTTANPTDDSVELTVSNTGCQLTAEQVSKVFDSFWRSDSSRSETGTHCGLGLSLVQRLVTALGGDAIAELQSDGIFTIRVILPDKL